MASTKTAVYRLIELDHGLGNFHSSDIHYWGYPLVALQTLWSLDVCTKDVSKIVSSVHENRR